MAAYHRLNSYLEAGTDREDIAGLDKKSLAELCSHVYALEGRFGDYDDKDILRMKKDEAIEKVWAKVVQPHLAWKQKRADEAAAARVAQLEAERTAGKVEELRVAIVEGLGESLAALEKRVEEARLKIVANPYGAITSYAKQLWLCSDCVYRLQSLKGWFEGDEAKDMLGSEIEAFIQNECDQILERTLSESFSKSTCALSNVKDECEHRAQAWYARVLRGLVAGWRKAEPKHIRFYAYLNV